MASTAFATVFPFAPLYHPPSLNPLLLSLLLSLLAGPGQFPVQSALCMLSVSVSSPFIRSLLANLILAPPLPLSLSLPVSVSLGLAASAYSIGQQIKVSGNKAEQSSDNINNEKEAQRKVAEGEKGDGEVEGEKERRGRYGRQPGAICAARFVRRN